MQIQRLLHTVAFIGQNKRRLAMELALVPNAKKLQDNSEHLFKHPLPSCNTVGCLAGWGVQLFDPEFAATAPFDMENVKKWEPIRDRAIKIFGLNYEQADQLFYVASWQQENAERYREAKTAAGRYAALKAQVDYVIRNRKEIA